MVMKVAGQALHSQHEVVRCFCRTTRLIGKLKTRADFVKRFHQGKINRRRSTYMRGQVEDIKDCTELVRSCENMSFRALRSISETDVHSSQSVVGITFSQLVFTIARTSAAEGIQGCLHDLPDLLPPPQQGVFLSGLHPLANLQLLNLIEDFYNLPFVLNQ